MARPKTAGSAYNAGSAYKRMQSGVPIESPGEPQHCKDVMARATSDVAGPAWDRRQDLRELLSIGATTFSS
jgi:hypothetical protein